MNWFLICVKKNTVFATEVLGIQMPRSNNYASLNQNNLDTSASCRLAPLLPDFITIASSVTYLVRTALVFNFTPPYGELQKIHLLQNFL
jgi:hypothetical protein